MSTPAPVRGLLFDMDGTLVDTETHTDRAIEEVAARHGVPGFSLPPAETRGRTWLHVAAMMRAQAGIDAGVDDLVGELLACWNAATAAVRPIPGAPEALRAAAQCGLRMAVVSSSPLAVIHRLVGGLGVLPLVDAAACVGGDGVRRGKPDPEGFLLAARRLGIEPAEALVFEDSQAGLLAAQAAGMRSLFIMCCATDVAGNRALATAATTSYLTLPPRFFEAVARGSLDFAGQVYP